MNIDYKHIKFVKNIKSHNKDEVSYDDKVLHKQFPLWFADKPCKEKYDIGDIVLLYQRLNDDSTATLTHLVEILEKTPKEDSGGYTLLVKVVGTVRVIKGVTSICDCVKFKGNGQSGKLVRLKEVIKGHISVKTVQKRILQIFAELGQVI